MSSGSLSPSTPQRPAELVWGLRSAALSSTATAAGCGQRRMNLAGPYFNSSCHPRKGVHELLNLLAESEPKGGIARVPPRSRLCRGSRWRGPSDPVGSCPRPCVGCIEPADAVVFGSLGMLQLRRVPVVPPSS